MADDPPISTNVPETVTVDQGVDKAQLGNLEANFDDFWKEQDAGVEAPAAPGPAQETKQAKPETKPPETGTKPAESETKQPEGVKLPETPPAAPEPRELTDEDIDKLEMPPNARPEVQQSFKEVKDHWKKDRAKLKLELDRARTLETQLTEAKRNSWTPEQKADYEHAAQVRRRFDFASDPHFIQTYQMPIRDLYQRIINDVVPMLPNREAATEWGNKMLTQYHPDKLSREYWEKDVINQVPSELDRSALRHQITQLLQLQRTRNEEITRVSADQSAFDNWMNEKTQFTAQRVQEEIMAEIGEQEKRIAEVLPRDVNAAKTTEERAAIEAHNERFNKLNNYFQTTMKDISANGPRAWVRASVEATRAQMADMRISELENELKATKSERDQYKSELDRITGARRKLAHTTGTPPTSTEKKNGLSIKDLDVRRAFDQFDWGDRT